jgi:16S rRNA (guanine966-N2)-methyltransferase
LRIVAGDWRGRKLIAPDGMSTRPTADRVRETLFSMLASRLGSFEGLRVADLYAGSGALGLEALSRGAAFACFVETDQRALAAIRTNVDSFGVADKSLVLARSAEALPLSEPFDLLFADPPYQPGAGSAALQNLLAARWAAAGCWIAIETGRGDPVDPFGLELDSERKVGPATITLLRSRTSLT